MSFIKDYFTYSRKERSGIIALFILMLLSISVYFAIDALTFSKPSYDYSQYKKEIDEFEKGQLALESNSTKPQSKSYTYKKNKTQYFLFNPNTLSYDSLLLLGIYPKISQRIVKYREAGGVFYQSKDLLKVYGVTEKLFAKIENYIRIPEQAKTETLEKSETKTKPSFKIIDINSADTSELKSINGIGSKLSLRIVQFRDKLGGFYSIEQLLEIYGLSQETFVKIKNQIEINQSYNKLKINTATAAELKKHPYIRTWNQANAIVNYREKHGNYKTAEDLLKTDLVDADLCRKIAPYLDFE